MSNPDPQITAVRVLIAGTAFAVITHDRGELTVQLTPGIGAPKSLGQSAAELREKAQQYERRARLIELAQARLAQGYQITTSRGTVVDAVV
jgi:hypothetical protein